MRVIVLTLALMLCGWGGPAALAPARAADDPKSREQPQPAHGAARPGIELRGALLSVRLRDAPWEAVLKDLEREMGVVIRVRGPLIGTLTQEFEDLSLEQGLRRLFRDANTLLFYATGESPDGPAGRLIALWVFPREGSAAERQIRSPSSGVPDAEKQEAVGFIANTTEAVPQEERLAALHAMAQQGNLEALREAAFDPDETIQLAALESLAERDQQEATAVLVGATKSDEPERRRQALTLLHQTGHGDEMTVVTALGEALADADASVKLYAIQALAERRGSAALESLRHALRDPDPSVRMFVIARLVPEGQGLELLWDALADDEKMVRELAASRLEGANSAER